MLQVINTLQPLDLFRFADEKTVHQYKNTGEFYSNYYICTNAAMPAFCPSSALVVKVTYEELVQKAV